jgi:hypothetical protein
VILGSLVCSFFAIPVLVQPQKWNMDDITEERVPNCATQIRGALDRSTDLFIKQRCDSEITSALCETDVMCVCIQRGM